MYYNNEDGNEPSSRQRRRHQRQSKTDASDITNEHGYDESTLESNVVPSYRKRQKNRRNMQGDSEDELNKIEKQTSKKRKPSSQRLPRSVSEEVLALEGKFNLDGSAKSNRQKTRKHRDIERTGTDPGLSAEKPPSGRKSSQTNKRRKRKRDLFASSGDDDDYQGDMDGELSDYLHVDQEDIISGPATNGKKSQSAIATRPTLSSQPLDFMFIEKKDGQGFMREHRSTIQKENQDKTDYDFQLLDANKDDTTLDFIFGIHIGFRKFATIVQGLLAGIALTQCVFVYILDSINDTNLLPNYYKLAQPFQSIYYICLAVSCVSIFDRYIDISASWRQLFMLFFTRPSRLFATLSYVTALVLSVSIASLDDRISLQKELPQLWKTRDRLNTWKIINLLRVVGCVLGWLMLAISPEDDHTEKTIQEAVKNVVDSRPNYEMKSLNSPRTNGYSTGLQNA